MRLKPVVAERAKERQTAGSNQYKRVEQKSAQGKTNEELAKVAGVSFFTG